MRNAGYRYSIRRFPSRVFSRTCCKISFLKKIFFLSFILSRALISCSQADSCHLRISLLTCSPGEELFTVWGHSALRVTDSIKRTDIVYNYGSFDFDAPGFYVNFARGNMQYFVSQSSFTDFVYEYQYYKRGIIEQLLNLDCSEKQQLASALAENAKEENKYYRYDFLYDNCSSRLRDIVSKNASAIPVFTDILPNKKITFWNLIHENLDKCHEPWGRLGIDILLGSKMDIIASSYQSMFLPDYLMKSFDSASIDGRKLVGSKKIILPAAASENKSNGVTPFIAFGLFFLVMAVCSFIKPVANSVFFAVFDFLLFLATGLQGILLLFLWFGRIDNSCSNNYNLAWALPTHAVVVFFMNQKKEWVKIYWLVSSIILLFLLITWKWLPQEMNDGLLPLIALLLLRSILRYKKQ
jgi:hypothetical protein